tara:strand:- start:300 stop:542 length:243 start_codon:yes stop_codon:yes gene_type:complete
LATYLLNNFSLDEGNSILVIGLIILLVLNISILVTNGFNLKGVDEETENNSKGTQKINKNQNIDQENLPDPLEEGFDLPL